MENNDLRRERKWQLRFSLSTLLIIITLLCLYLGWRFRTTSEERALSEIRTELDAVFYVWERPTLKKMSPVQPEYNEEIEHSDGTKQVKTRYHDHSYLLRPDPNASRPQPDFIDRWLGREPREHVVGVLLPDYNVNDENLSRLKKLPYLKYVIVRNVHESANGPENTMLIKVRKALPNAEVVGEKWQLHPKNQK